MSVNSPAEVAAQYATDRHLRTRIETHERYGVGPRLEPEVDRLLSLRGDEVLLDVGTGPGDFPGRLRAEGHQGRSALVFPASGPVLTYLESIPSSQNLAEDDRTRVLTTLRQALAPRFRAGEWRVSKRVAFLRAVRRERPFIARSLLTR